MEENKMLYFITSESRGEGRGLQSKLRAVAVFFRLVPMLILRLFASDWTDLNLCDPSCCTYADKEEQFINK